jgi:hypothetical protein
MTEREISTDTYNDVVKPVFVTFYAACTANRGADEYLGGTDFIPKEDHI